MAAYDVYANDDHQTASFDATQTASFDANQTASFDATKKRTKKQCSICNTFVDASNMARHRRTKRCSSASGGQQNTAIVVAASTKISTKQYCILCGVTVNASNMARHRRSKRCASIHQSVTPTPPPSPDHISSSLPSSLPSSPHHVSSSLPSSPPKSIDSSEWLEEKPTL